MSEITSFRLHSHEKPSMFDYRGSQKRCSASQFFTSGMFVHHPCFIHVRFPGFQMFYLFCLVAIYYIIVRLTILNLSNSKLTKFSCCTVALLLPCLAKISLYQFSQLSAMHFVWFYFWEFNIESYNIPLVVLFFSVKFCLNIYWYHEEKSSVGLSWKWKG